MGFFDRLKKGLNKTRENLTNKIEKIIIGYADIDDDLLDELEETLIMADVGVQTTDKLMTAVRKGIKKKEINTPEDLKPFLQKQIVEILTAGEDTTRIAEQGPTVLLVIGVNGAGKTTTIGKLAAYYKGQASRSCSPRPTPSARRPSTSSRFGDSARACLSSSTKRALTRRPSPSMPSRQPSRARSTC